MLNWIQTHGADALLAFYVFSACVSGMVPPTEKSSAVYKWAYSTLHTLSGDLSNFIQRPTQSVVGDK